VVSRRAKRENAARRRWDDNRRRMKEAREATKARTYDAADLRVLLNGKELPGMAVADAAIERQADEIAKHVRERMNEYMRLQLPARPSGLRIPLPDGSHLTLLPFEPRITAISCFNHPFWGRSVEILASVKEVGSGLPESITGFHGEDATTQGKPWAQLVRDELIRLVTHEIDECLRHADGTHVTDPHPELRRQPPPLPEVEWPALDFLPYPKGFEP
jgi:hypothetical protein